MIVPLEFSFPEAVDSEYFKVADYAIDGLFLVDMVLNFRTSYMDLKSELLMTNWKKIAFNYVFRGRFWLDLAASLPFDELYTLFASESNVKFGIKFLTLGLMLILVLHWASCIWYYLIQVDKLWCPPKDNGLSSTVIY